MYTYIWKCLLNFNELNKYINGRVGIDGSIIIMMIKINWKQAQYIMVLCSFKEQLQQHVRVHAVEAVMACREIENNLHSLTGSFYLISLNMYNIKENVKYCLRHLLYHLESDIQNRIITKTKFLLKLTVFKNNNRVIRYLKVDVLIRYQI